LDSSKLNYTLKLCSINQSCDPSLNNFDKKSNIYSSERIISTNLTLDNLDRAKRIRVFYWEIA
ncbi:MAG: hypothetical protein WCK29_03195, partial [archaeon]